MLELEQDEGGAGSTGGRLGYERQKLSGLECGRGGRIAPDDWTLQCAGRYRLRPALSQDRLMLQLLGFIIDCPDPMKLAAFYLSWLTEAGFGVA